MEKLNIVCLSNQFYDFPLKTNKWHVMSRLARMGHNVIFIDPPTRFSFLKKLIRGLSNFDFPKNLRTEGSLHIYTPANLFNFKPFSRFNTSRHLKKVNNILTSFDSNKTVLWIYHFDFPDLENFIKGFKFNLVIYDVVDEYEAFPQYSDRTTTNTGIVALIQKIDNYLQVKLNQNDLSGKEWVRARERWLGEIADLIFASAPGLVIKFQRIVGELGRDLGIVHFVPNSGDYLRFKDTQEHRKLVPQDLESIPRPRILTYGAIDSYKMNLELIEKCAQIYSNYSFVLIGPEKVSDPNLDLKELKSMNNVHFLGLRPFERLPYYSASSDVFIIPYNLNEYTVGGCFPIKFHEALSSGLPTVVTNMPAYKPFSHVCYIAKSDDEFIDLIKVALEEDSDKKRTERQSVAKENSWENKVAAQLELISQQVLKK